MLDVPVVGSVSKTGLYPASSSLKASRLLSFAGGLDNLEDNNVNFEVGTNQNISQYELQGMHRFKCYISKCKKKLQKLK